MKRESNLPPGIMRSAPPIRTGITEPGVLRLGSKDGFFHNV